MVVSALRPKAVSVHWIGCFFLAAVVLVHFGLVGLGQWLADEYDDFGRLERDGWSFIWERLKWSPRPLSEALFCAYGWVVNHLHRPLIGVFLGMLWMGLIMAGLVTFWQKYRKHQEEEIWPELLVPLTLMALFVAGAGHTTWVFYWPAAAVAYLPTVAATLLLFLQVARGRLSSSGGRLLCGCCLIVAAGTSETGATFVLCYGLLQAVQVVVAAFKGRDNLSNPAFVWWSLPTLVSLVVLLIVRLNRSHVIERPGLPVGPTKGQPLTSLIASTHELFVEGLGRSAHFFGWHGLGSRLPSEILLALGVGLCWSRFGRLPRATARQILALVAALWLACLCTIAAANLHFGVVCCDQHESVRRCWLLLSIAGIGMLLSPWIGRGRLRQYAISSTLAQFLLCAAVLSVWHITPVLRTYGMYGSVRHATEQNFQAGFQTGDKQMVFLLLPQTLIAQPQIGPGNYTQRFEKPPDIQNVLTFFKKSSMVARSPTDWLYDRHR